MKTPFDIILLDVIMPMLNGIDTAKEIRQEVDFSVTVELDELSVDEIQFSSIISNAIDNALNAQAKLPVGSRQITLMIKDSEGKLLFSVKNPYKDAPVFANGLPITDEKNHGYGTKSICYITEKLGGKCQFAIQNELFVLRVIL